MKLGMKHLRLKYYNVYHDPAMTLTYFTARSILETLAFTWEKVKTMDFFKTIAQGSHRLEKYLKMKGCLEKYLKTKFALKSAGKLTIGLEKHLNFTSSGIPDNKIRFQNQM